MPAIQSIQRGTLVTTQNDASPNAVVTITPVITANAVVMFTSKDTDNQDKDHRHLYSAYLSSASQITFTRFSQSFATNTTIEWEVVEFAAGALQSLQTGSISPTAAVTSVALATPVNPAAAVPLVTEWTNNSPLQYVTPLPSITTTTTAGDTLKFTLPSAPAAGLYNCRWQLIEFKAADASVQSGTTTLGSTGAYSATQAIAPVDLTKTLVAAFHYGGSTSTDARQSMRYFPASSTLLQFDMQPNGSMSPATIQWYTVTLLDGSSVQSGNLNILAGATVPTTQPSWSAMTHGSMWSPHQFANAYITGTVDSDPWDVHLAYHFNSTQDGATVSRGGSVTPVSSYYQAVDWASSGATSTGGGTDTGTLTWTEDNDVSSIVSLVTNRASITWVESHDIHSLVTLVTDRAVISYQEDNDIHAISASMSGGPSYLAWTEDNDIYAIQGRVSDLGILLWTEANDTHTMSGQVYNNIMMGWTESDDTSLITGVVTNFGIMSWTEQNDGVLFLPSNSANGSMRRRKGIHK